MNDVQVTSALVHIARGNPGPWHPAVRTFNAVGDRPHVKLMASLGPASNSPDQITAMIANGADRFRINLSHVEGPEQMAYVAQRLLWTRLAAAGLRREVCCLVDTRGVEIRTRGEEPLSLTAGERVRLTTRPGVSHRGSEGPTIHLRVPRSYDLVANLKVEAPREVPPTVFIDDGQIVIQLQGWPEVFDPGAPETDFWGVVHQGGVIPKTPKGVNFPDFALSGLPDLVAEDQEALTQIFSPDFFGTVLAATDLSVAPPIATLAATGHLQSLARYLGVDAIALSFTRHARMVAAYDGLLKKLRASHVMLEPKIETPGAAEPAILREILRHPRVGGVWLARGDFSVNAGLVNVPAYEDRITAAARAHMKPATLATRILSSLASGGHGTQPEFDAIFAALQLGFHELMFSGETAAPIPGMTPADVIRLAAATAASPSMEQYIARSEVRRSQSRDVYEAWDRVAGEALQTDAAIGTQTTGERRKLRKYIYSLIVDHVRKSERHSAIGAMVLWSETGGSMRAVASALPSRPVFVVTNNPRVAREGAGLRGIFPILIRGKPESGRALVDIVRTVLTPPSSAPRDLLVQVLHNLG